MVYTKNVLLEFAKLSHFGWVKELCYQTLEYGELDAAGIQKVFDVFIANINAVTAEPIPQAEQRLELYSMIHVEGVNVLKSSEEIQFCQQGMTIFYGQNATGKSGYFRVLEHLAGGLLAKPILNNIYADAPALPHCIFKYTLDGSLQVDYDWTNMDVCKGKAPFNRITVFDSSYAEHLIRQHDSNEYMLSIYGYTSCSVFYSNYAKLKDKVRAEIPEKETELENDEIQSLNLDMVYDKYVTALNIRFEEKLKKLLKKDIGISVKKIIEEGRPELVVQLSRPYDVKAVLSEGEQKALALALLLADNELKETKDPIVLDDPVNSLDNNIIRRFAEELIKLDNQVILFSHNYWFVNYIVNSKETRKYDTNIPLPQRTSPKKYILPYEVICLDGVRGVITKYNAPKAKIYLDEAKRYLDTVPFERTIASHVVLSLRLAIEQLVDEKVFLNLTPCKYRGHTQNIPWVDLCQLSMVPVETIQMLQEQFNALSDGGGHYSEGMLEDPLDHDELREIYDKLITL